jgi:hypothetical protein
LERAPERVTQRRPAAGREVGEPGDPVQHLAGKRVADRRAEVGGDQVRDDILIGRDRSGQIEQAAPDVPAEGDGVLAARPVLSRAIEDAVPGRGAALALVEAADDLAGTRICADLLYVFKTARPGRSRRRLGALRLRSRWRSRCGGASAGRLARKRWASGRRRPESVTAWPAGTGDGSRSVIVWVGQNPSRAPSAAASPQTLDRTCPKVPEIAAIGSGGTAGALMLKRQQARSQPILSLAMPAPLVIIEPDSLAPGSVLLAW